MAVSPTDEELRACCAADAWLSLMQHARPFESVEDMVRLSDQALLELDDSGLDQALAAHARIGERRLGSTTEDRWSRTEQAGALAADDEVQRRLTEGNRAYEDRFGHVFLIRAAGRDAEDMLRALEQRLAHDSETERDVVRRELAEIVRLRLERVVAEESRRARPAAQAEGRGR